MSKYLLCVASLLLVINTAWSHPTTVQKSTEHVTASTCGGKIFANQGTIDYLFPEGESYPGNVDCIWTVFLEYPHSHVQLIKTESDLNLGAEFVSVQSFWPRGGGQGPMTKENATFGLDTNEQEEAVLAGAFFIVVFSSSEQSNKRGFTLQFRGIGDRPFSSVEITEDFHNEDVEGALSYPFEGTRYRSRTLASFVVKNTQNNGQKIALTIDSYDIERDGMCEVRDTLEVHKVEGGRISFVATYCGSSNGYPVVHDPQHAYILLFRSDTLIEQSGFQFHWNLSQE